jgi:hypothetical protein
MDSWTESTMPVYESMANSETFWTIEPYISDRDFMRSKGHFCSNRGCWFMDEPWWRLTGRGGDAGSRAAAPWFDSPAMATWRLRCAFLSVVLTYVGGEARGLHLGGPQKAAMTGNWHATSVGFAQALVRAWDRGGGPPVMGQGLVAAAWHPCWCPQVSGAWGGFKWRSDGMLMRTRVSSGKTRTLRPTLRLFIWVLLPNSVQQG